MAKGAKKSSTKRTSSTKGGKRAGGRKPKRTWSTYVRRSLKQVSADARMSGRTLRVVNSFISDWFDRIATEAGSLARANTKKTLGSREVQTAVRLLLPPELAKHAISEATSAAAEYAKGGKK